MKSPICVVFEAERNDINKSYRWNKMIKTSSEALPKMAEEPVGRGSAASFNRNLEKQ